MKSSLVVSIVIAALFNFSPAARATIDWTDSDFVLNAPGLCSPSQDFSFTYKVASGALVNYATITHRQNASAGIDCSNHPISWMGATYDIVSCTEDLKIVGARDAMRDGYRSLIYEAYYGPFRIKIDGYGCAGENGQKLDAKLGACMNVVSDLSMLESIYESSYGSVTNAIKTECAPDQAGIRFGDMERTPFTSDPEENDDYSFWIEFFDPEGRDKLNLFAFFLRSEHRSKNIGPEFLDVAGRLLAEGKLTMETTPFSYKFNFNIDFRDLRNLLGLTGPELAHIQEDTLTLNIRRIDSEETRLSGSATFYLPGKAPSVFFDFTWGDPGDDPSKPWLIIRDGDGIEDLDWSTLRIEQVKAGASVENWFLYYLGLALPYGLAEIIVEKDPFVDSEKQSQIRAIFDLRVDRCKLLCFPDETEIIKISISDKLGYTASHEQAVGLSGCMDDWS